MPPVPAEHDDDIGLEVPSSALREPRGLPRTAWASLDTVDLLAELRIQVPCLKSVPYFMRPGVRTAYRLALEGIQRSSRQPEEGRGTVRAWTLFLLVSRMLLHKPSGENRIPKEELLSRLDRFQRGEWQQLLAESHVTARQSREVRAAGLRAQPTLEAKAARAQAYIELGEVSSARQALVGGEIAPGNGATLQQLRDPTRRLQHPREALPPEVQQFVPVLPLAFPKERFVRNLRGSRRGAAPGPTGTTAEHCKQYWKMSIVSICFLERPSALLRPTSLIL